MPEVSVQNEKNEQLQIAEFKCTFHRRFVLEITEDGHGSPRTCLALLRQLFTNGMVADCAAFRSKVKAGDVIAYVIQRAITTFDSEEGFDMLKQRTDSARDYRELSKVQRCIPCVSELKGNTFRPMQADSSLRRVARYPHESYGVTKLDELPFKRQRLLPNKCRVYHLLNYLSELSSHHALMKMRTRIDRLVGTLVSEEYDLEGSANGNSDFADCTMNERYKSAGLSTMSTTKLPSKSAIDLLHCELVNIVRANLVDDEVRRHDLVDDIAQEIWVDLLQKNTFWRQV